MLRKSRFLRLPDPAPPGSPAYDGMRSARIERALAAHLPHINRWLTTPLACLLGIPTGLIAGSAILSVF